MKFKLLFLFIISVSYLSGQTQVDLRNPNFSIGKAAPSYYNNGHMREWEDCGKAQFPVESGFDVQPGSFQVTTKPKVGSAYIGLVTRDNGTYECICQELDIEIIEHTQYVLSVYLAKAEVYSSLAVQDRIDGADSTFHVNSTVLRIWGGLSVRNKDELLYESEVIDHHEWKNYIAQFTPKETHKYLHFEVYYCGENNNQNGNLLIDAINHVDIDNSTLNELRNQKQAALESELKKQIAYDLIDYIEAMKVDSASNFPHLEVIKNMSSLNENKGNIPYFINSFADNKFEGIVESASKVGSPKMASFFDRQFELKSKKSLSKEEEEYFVNATDLFEEINAEKSLQLFMVEYVRANRDEIIEEILRCF